MEYEEGMRMNDVEEVEKLLDKLDQLFLLSPCPNCGFEMLLIITERPDPKENIECPACGHKTPAIELIKNALRDSDKQNRRE